MLKQLLTSVPKSSTATTKVLRDIRVKSLKVLTGVDTSDKGDCFEESFNNNSGIYDAESLLPNRSSIQDSDESEKIRYEAHEFWVSCLILYGCLGLCLLGLIKKHLRQSNSDLHFVSSEPVTFNLGDWLLKLVGEPQCKEKCSADGILLNYSIKTSIQI